MKAAICGSGMVTAVGLDAPSSSAAIRAGISGAVETKFTFDGEWLLGCPVPLDDQWRGREKLICLAASAIRECLDCAADVTPTDIPLLLCLSEGDRPGRFPGLDESLLAEIQTRLDVTFHPESTSIAGGCPGGAHAVGLAQQLLERGHSFCIVAGADTLLVSETLSSLYHRHRLLTETNSDGFIPGEAAAAVLLGPVDPKGQEQLCCLGLGYGEEPASLESEDPLRADGMVAAFRAALNDAGTTFRDIDYRLADLSGEQYSFKEASLALNRVLRDRKVEFDLWHPAECVGKVGAATVPLVLGVALAAAQQQYAPGPGVLCHFAADGTERAAMVLRYQNGSAA